eukprot:5468193-Amphidinium_carterae.1
MVEGWPAESLCSNACRMMSVLNCFELPLGGMGAERCSGTRGARVAGRGYNGCSRTRIWGRTCQ